LESLFKSLTVDLAIIIEAGAGAQLDADRAVRSNRGGANCA